MISIRKKIKLIKWCIEYFDTLGYADMEVDELRQWLEELEDEENKLVSGIGPGRVGK